MIAWATARLVRFGHKPRLGADSTSAGRAKPLRIGHESATPEAMVAPDPNSDPIASLRPVLDTALDAVVVMRSDGCVAGWNATAERTFGWTSAEAIGRPMADLIIPPQYREAHDRGLARYNSTGEERVLNRRIEISAVTRDGREFPVELSITRAPGPGSATAFIGFLRDISERRDAEARLSRQARETQLLFEVTRLAAETGSFEEALRSCLEAICNITGWPVGHALVVDRASGSELVSTQVWHEEEPGIAAAMKQATREMRFTRGVGLPGMILASGEPAWVADAAADPNFARKDLGFASAFGFPVRSEGRIIAVLEFFTRGTAEPDSDLMLIVRTLGEQVGRVLERKRTEEHQLLLVNELNHRVKNMLAIVQSIAAQTFKTESESGRRAFESRLAALASAHDLLTSESWEAASLRHVVERATMGCGAFSDRLRVEGPDLRIQPKTAVSISMAIHELCTNAVKYGALSNDSGKVALQWEVTGPDEAKRLRLTWHETGGPPVSEPRRRGFGSRMIERGLAAELGGTAVLHFQPEGLCCLVDAPLPAAEDTDRS